MLFSNASLDGMAERCRTPQRLALSATGGSIPPPGGLPREPSGDSRWIHCCRTRCGSGSQCRQKLEARGLVPRANPAVPSRDPSATLRHGQDDRAASPDCHRRAARCDRGGGVPAPSRDDRFQFPRSTQRPSGIPSRRVSWASRQATERCSPADRSYRSAARSNPRRTRSCQAVGFIRVARCPDPATL